MDFRSFVFSLTLLGAAIGIGVGVVTQPFVTTITLLLLYYVCRASMQTDQPMD